MRHLIEDAEYTKGCHEAESTRYVAKTAAQGGSAKAAIATVCPDPMTKMAGGDNAATVDSFLAHEVPSPVASQSGTSFWKFYNDSGTKFGYILDASKDGAAEAISKYCSSKSKRRSMTIESIEDNSSFNESTTQASRELAQQESGAAAGDCATFATVSTLSFKMVFSSSGDASQQPTLQVSYLKSHYEYMSSIYLWVDEDFEHRVELSGKWDDPYSVTHFTTLSAHPITHINTFALGEWMSLPSLTPGEHTIHLAGKAVDKKLFKFKLISLTSC